MTSTRSAQPPPPAPGQVWRDWMFARTVGARRMLLRHRDGARLVAGSSPTPRVLAELDADVATLAGFGFAPVEALGAIMSLSHYVIGFVLQEQAVRRRLVEAGLDPALPDVSERLVRLLGEVPAPTLREAFAAGGTPIGDAAFESGARLIIAGLTTASARDRPMVPDHEVGQVRVEEAPTTGRPTTPVLPSP